MGSTRNSSIDLFRFWGAVCVVFLHIAYGSINSDSIVLLRLLSRWAVPFFFLVSGYLFLLTYERSGISSFQKVLKTLVSIAVVANLVYLIVRIFSGELKGIFSVQTLLTGDYFHLWFLHSQIIAYLALWALFYFKQSKLIFPLAFIIFILLLISEPYKEVLGLQKSVLPVRYSLAFVYITIGYSAHRFLKYVSAKAAFILIFAGIIMQFTEAYLLKTYYGVDPFTIQFLAGTPLFALGIFALCIIDIFPGGGILATYGKVYSLAIYLYHPLINLAIFSIGTYFPFWNSGFFLYLRPIIVIAIDVGVIVLAGRTFPRFLETLNGKWRN